MRPIDRPDLMGLIGRIYDAALTPQLWSCFMDEAFRAFHAEQGSVVLLTNDDVGPATVETMGFDLACLPEFHECTNSEVYWWIAAREFRAGAVFRGTDLVSAGEMFRKPFYREAARDLDAEYLVGAVIENSAKSAAFFSLMRPKTQNDFTEQDKSLVAQLLPHVRRAFLIQREVIRKERIRAACDDILYQLNCGVHVLDEKGRHLFVNRAAEEIFRRKDGVQLIQGQIRLFCPSEDMQLRSLIRGVVNAATGTVISAGGVMTARRPSGKRPYQLLVTLLGSRTEDHGTLAGTVALFITDPESALTSQQAMLINNYKLTTTEAKVCRALFSAPTNAKIAGELRISPNTVKAHLRQIFAKTGVSSKAELFRELSLQCSWLEATGRQAGTSLH